jgi:hypothetical protein
MFSTLPMMESGMVADMPIGTHMADGKTQGAYIVTFTARALTDGNKHASFDTIICLCYASTSIFITSSPSAPLNF